MNYLHHLNITDIKEGELSFIQVAALLLNSYLMPTTADEFRHNSPKEAIMARADFSPREKQMLLHCLPDGNMAERLIVIRDLARLGHADIARTAYRYIVFHSPLARFSYLNSIVGLETAYHMTMAENYNLCIKEAAASLEPHITKIEAIQMYQHIKEYNDPIIGDIITQKLHTLLDE